MTHIKCFGEETGKISLTDIKGGLESGATVDITVTGPNAYLRTVTNVGSNFEFRNLEAGIYDIQFKQNGACNDVKNETVEIFQPKQLYAEITDSTISLPDQPTGSLTLEVDGRTGTGQYYATAELIYPDTYSLFLGDTVRVNPSSLNYELTFKDLYPGEYEVYVSDFNGCDTTMHVLIDFDKSIFIPNVFTPNGDQYNETFYIRNLPDEGAKLVVTNRWGKVVYENNSYTNEKSWNGGDLADGVYYYKLTTTEESFTGWVEIWRGARPK